MEKPFGYGHIPDEHAKMSLITDGLYRWICCFCNGCHVDSKDKSVKLKEQCIYRMSHFGSYDNKDRLKREKEIPQGMFAVRLRTHFYSHFHAYAFAHFTAIPYVMKKNVISFCKNGYNLLAWGPSNVLTTRCVQRGRDLGIINDEEDGRNLRGQQRLDDFFASHPEHIDEQHMFGRNMHLLGVSLLFRENIANVLGIVPAGQDLTQEAVDEWFEKNPNNRYCFHFGIDVEPLIY